MTYLDELANDWRHTPGVVDLVHVAGGIETSGVKAHLSLDGPSPREVTAGAVAVIQSTDSIWYVWAVTLPGVRPKKGDTLREADGTEWTVLLVKSKRESEPGRSLVITWECTCREKV